MKLYIWIMAFIMGLSLASAINGINIGLNDINGIDVSPPIQIVSSGNGTTNNYYNITYNITDYCFANGTNSSNVDCIPYTSRENIFTGNNSFSQNIRLQGVTSILEFLNWDISSGDPEFYTVEPLITQIYMNHTTHNMMFYNPYGNFSFNSNITANYFIGNGSRLTGVCLSNGTSCQTTSGSMDYTNLAMRNDSNVFTGNTTTLQNMYTGRGTNQSIRISASSFPDYNGLYQHIGSVNGKNLYSNGQAYIWWSSGFWFTSPRPNWQEYDFYIFSSADTPPISSGWSPQLGATGTMQTLVGEKNATIQTSTDGSIVIRNNTVTGGNLIVYGKSINVINGRTIFNCNNTAIPFGNYQFCADDGTTVVGEFISTNPTNNYWIIGGVTTLQTIGGLAVFGSNAPEGSQISGNNLPAATGKAPEFGIGWLVESIGVGNITQVIRAEAGQTTDNLQVQNSAGGVLSRIRSDGGIIAPNICYSDGTNCTSSGGGNSSWNESRANLLYSTIQWGYNMTTPFTTWLSTFAYNYNQTYTGGTYNATYNGYNTSYGYTWKNWTGEANSTIYNAYGKWFYNMSTGGSATPNDGITIKYQNITNIPSCSAGQVLTNLTGSLSCVTPTATVVRNINYTTVNSINATGLTFVPLFTTTVSANTNYTYDCKIVRSSNVTTSGVRYNITMSGVPTYITFHQEAFTTATAVQNNICQGSVRSCMPTAVTASLTYPTGLRDELNAYIEVGASAGGQMNLSFSGELANLLAVVQRGSYCELKAV